MAAVGRADFRRMNFAVVALAVVVLASPHDGEHNALQKRTHSENENCGDKHVKPRSRLARVSILARSRRRRRKDLIRKGLSTLFERVRGGDGDPFGSSTQDLFAINDEPGMSPFRPETASDPHLFEKPKAGTRVKIPEILAPTRRELSYDMFEAGSVRAALKRAGLPLGRMAMSVDEMKSKEARRLSKPLFVDPSTGFAGAMRRAEDDDDDDDIVGHEEQRQDSGKLSEAAQKEYNNRIQQLKTMSENIVAEREQDEVRQSDEEAEGGRIGFVMNANTVHEKVVPSVPPPGLSDKEQAEWLLRHPTPIASPFLQLQQDLKALDSEERKERAKKREEKHLEAGEYDESVFAAAVASGLGGGGGGNGGGNKNQDHEWRDDENFDEGRMARGIRMVDVRFETSLGNFDVELYYSMVPAAVHFFASLCKASFYDGLTFHRKCTNWIIQGGDPKGDGEGGNCKGYRIKNEVQPELRHTGAGIIGLASNDPAKPNSQFYITLGPTPPLDGQFTILGRVSNGIETIKNMNGLPVDKYDRPQQFAGIYRAYLLTGKSLIARIAPQIKRVNDDESDPDDIEVIELKKRRKRERAQQKPRVDTGKSTELDAERFISNLITDTPQLSEDDDRGALEVLNGTDMYNEKCRKMAKEQEMKKMELISQGEEQTTDKILASLFLLPEAVDQNRHKGR